MMPIARGRLQRGAIDVALGDRRQADKIARCGDLLGAAASGRRRRTRHARRCRSARARARAHSTPDDDPKPSRPGTTMRTTGMPNLAGASDRPRSLVKPDRPQPVEKPIDLGFEGFEPRSLRPTRNLARRRGWSHAARAAALLRGEASSIDSRRARCPRANRRCRSCGLGPPRNRAQQARSSRVG